MSYTYEYPRPAVTVDAAVFNKENGLWKILLIRRGKDPFKGMWALPGGFVEMDETLEESIARELEEETGLTNIELTQLHTFSTVNRDPRHRTISTVFTGIIATTNFDARAGDDASEVKWIEITRLPELAFDHEEVIAMAVKQLELQL